jgi:hypothetical protein
MGQSASVPVGCGGDGHGLSAFAHPADYRLGDEQAGQWSDVASVTVGS